MGSDCAVPISTKTHESAPTTLDTATAESPEISQLQQQQRLPQPHQLHHRVPARSAGTFQTRPLQIAMLWKERDSCADLLQSRAEDAKLEGVAPGSQSTVS